MKLSLGLGAAGYTSDQLKTGSVITLDNGKVTWSELKLKALAPGISSEAFAEIACNAEQTCPASQAFNLEIVLNAELIA